MSPPIRTAVILILVLLGYFAIDNHVSLRPWNHLEAAGPQFASTLTAVIPFGLVIAALLAELRWGIMLGLIWSVVWLLLQIRQWWIPYLLGPTFLHANLD